MGMYDNCGMTVFSFATIFSTLLTLSQTSSCFYVSFDNTAGKGEIACNEQFLLFPQCFLPI